MTMIAEPTSPLVNRDAVKSELAEVEKRIRELEEYQRKAAMLRALLEIESELTEPESHHRRRHGAPRARADLEGTSTKDAIISILRDSSGQSLATADIHRAMRERGWSIGEDVDDDGLGAVRTALSRMTHDKEAPVLRATKGRYRYRLTPR